jgi:glycosyltransferase involved in cell wall biosynthesis
MKIAFLSTFYPYRGGIAQFNASVYRAFEKKHEVKAYTFTRQYPNFLFPGETQFVTEKDVVDPIPAKRILDTINPFSYLKAGRIIRKDSPDVLLMKYWMTFFAPALGTVCKLVGKQTKRIVILDNFIPHEKRFFDRAFNNYLVKHVDGYVVMSDSVLDDLLSVVPNAKYVRLNHPLYDHFGPGMDREEACQRLKLNPAKKYVLFFGFIRDYKGLDQLIQAMQLVDEGIELIVAGEVYGSFEKYQALIDESKVADRIHLFNNYISDKEVGQFFSASEVCVLPYKSATQSGITSISYHFEIPMIATDVGGLKETIFDGKTGDIIRENSPKGIAEALNRYIAENHKEAYIPAVIDYKNAHSWDQFVVDLEKFIEKISE